MFFRGFFLLFDDDEVPLFAEAGVVPYITLRVKFDEEGAPVLGSKRIIKTPSNRKIRLKLILEEYDPDTVPPSWSRIDVTGWKAFWRSALDVDNTPPTEELPYKWEVEGVIDGVPADGTFIFTVDLASTTFQVQHGYSEVSFCPDGTNEESRIPITFTFTKAMTATPPPAP